MATVESLINELTDLIIQYNTLAGMDKNLQLDKSTIMSECIYKNNVLDKRSLVSYIKNLKINIHTLEKHRRRFKLLRLEGEVGPAGVGVQSTKNNGDGTFTITYTDGTTFTSSDLTGNGIASTVDNEDGTFTITYTDGTTFTTSNLTGNGIASTVDNGNGTFTITYDDGTSFTTSDLTGPQGIQGISGETGNGIASTTDNGNGTFTITYDNGSSFTTSDLTGPQGIQGLTGNGIASTTDNGNGTFTITYDDGSSFTTSDLTGPQGEPGDPADNTLLFDQPAAPYTDETTTAPEQSGTSITLNWENELGQISGNGTELPYISGLKIDSRPAGGTDSEWVTIVTIPNRNTTTYTLTSEHITLGSVYDVRVYGYNALTSTTTPNFLLFENLSTTPIGVPNSPQVVSFVNSSITSINISVTKPDDHDVDNPGIQLTPDIESYKIIYTPTDSLRYGGIYNSNAVELIENYSTPTQSINKTGLLPGTTYSISASAKNTINTNYGSALNISSNPSTNLPTPTSTLTIQSSSLPANTYNLLQSSGSPQTKSGVYRYSQRANITALNNTLVLLNAINKIGVDAIDTISTFSLSVNGNITTKDITGFNTLPLSGNNGTLANGFTTFTLSNTIDAGSNETAGFYINGTINLTIDLLNVGIPYGSLNTVTLNSSSQGIEGQTYLFYVDDLNGLPTVSGLTLSTPTIVSSTTYFGITSVNSATTNLNATLNNFAHYFINTNNRVAEMNLVSGSSNTSVYSTYTSTPNPGSIGVSGTLTYNKSSGSIFLDTIEGRIRGLSINGNSSYSNTNTTETIYSDGNNNPGSSIMSSSSGEFPTSGYTTVYNHNSEIPDNQLMYANGKWRSGGDANAFKDYSGTLGNTYDYTGKQTLGDSLVDPNDELSNINIKWVTYRFAHPGVADVTFSNVNVITDDDLNRDVNHIDYGYVIEYDNTGARTTPWRDITVGFNSLQPNWDPAVNTDGSGGAKITNTTFKLRNSINSQFVYLRIGLNANSSESKSFGSITMSSV